MAGALLFFPPPAISSVSTLLVRDYFLLALLPACARLHKNPKPNARWRDASAA